MGAAEVGLERRAERLAALPRAGLPSGARLPGPSVSSGLFGGECPCSHPQSSTAGALT
jgi:hypothetical protein